MGVLILSHSNEPLAIALYLTNRYEGGINDLILLLEKKTNMHIFQNVKL